MRIAIRADASPLIGSGHIIRCLALANELCRSGASVHFISRQMPKALQDLVIRQGHEIVAYPLDTDNGWDWEQDAARTIAALAALAPSAPSDWLILDHYGLDARWSEKLRPCARRYLVIDDLADRPISADLLLDQNFQRDPASRYAGLLRHPNTRLLLGPEYALLREEFSDGAQVARPANAKIHRILVAFGGADSKNVTGFIVEALLAILDESIDIVGVVGSMHPAKEQLRALAGRHANLSIIVDTKDMATLMRECDLAIGGGGIMSLERMCMGLPAIVIALENNQAVASQYLTERGLITYLGRADMLDARALQRVVQQALSGGIDLAGQSAAGRALVDGQGAKRVAACMMEGQD